jgi:stage V sporulation protein AE
MIIKSFLFTGFICLIAQIIKDTTNLTNGHITTLFVILGSILSYFGIYDKIIYFVGGGANVVIMSFGNTLYNTALLDGIFNMLSGCSIGITSSILFAFITTIIFKSIS